MTEAPKRRGRPPFVPTDEQRKNVKILVGLGIPEEQICALVRDHRDRPIGPDTLRKHFRKEIEMGAVELNAQVGNFIISTMLGIEPPAGIKPITDEKTRGSFTDLFARSRLGWKQTVRNEVANADGKPFVYVANKTDAGPIVSRHKCRPAAAPLGSVRHRMFLLALPLPQAPGFVAQAASLARAAADKLHATAVAETGEKAQRALAQYPREAVFPLKAGVSATLLEVDQRNVAGEGRRPANVNRALPINFCGGPDEIIAQLQQACGQIGCGVVDLSFQTPSSEHPDQLMEAPELFGKKVLPHIRDA